MIAWHEIILEVYSYLTYVWSTSSSWVKVNAQAINFDKLTAIPGPRLDQVPSVLMYSY